MGIVAVTPINNRVDDAEAVGGVTSIGGGAGAAAEGAFFYQGALLWNRKVTSSTGAGFYYNPASDGGLAQDMTTLPNRTLLVKAIVTDYGGLQPTDGFRIRIGSGTAAYYAYVIAGTDAKINSLLKYPARGGFIIIPIDPSIAAYRDAVLSVGAPVLTAVDYFGIVAAFATASAKSENVGLDAIDLAEGLIITGGDGADPDATWQSPVDYDEGIIANRIGLASSTFDKVKLFFGSIHMGSEAVVVFTDTTSQVLWPDGLFAKGWSTAFMDISNALSIIVDGANQTGLGDITTEDTRPNYIVIGNEGAHTYSGVLNNFGVVGFMPASTVINATIEAAVININSSEFSNSKIVTRSLSGVASINDIAVTDQYHYKRSSGGLVTRLDGSYRRGQSFTAAKAGALVKANFWLDKVGVPTGNATAKLYAHTGTFGVSSLPTGAALATSGLLDISTIPVLSGAGEYGKQEFEMLFTDGYELVEGTKYVIVFELEAGGSSDASNYIAVLRDNVDFIHSGNSVYYNGAWLSSASTNNVFEVSIATAITVSDTEIKQGESGHAIELTDIRDHTLTGITFTDYGVDGANDAAIYNNSGGHINITITGGGNSPTVKNGAGSTTTISNPKILTVNGIPAGLEARVRKGAYSVLHESNIQDGDFVYSYNFANKIPITVTIGGVADSGVAYERRELQVFEENFDQTFVFEKVINPSYK